MAWFALIRGSDNIQTELLASASGSSELFVAAPPEFRTQVQQYQDVFAEPCEPAPGQVSHRIDLHDKSLMPPKQRAYRMSPEEMAEARQEIDSMFYRRDGFIRLRAHTVIHFSLYIRRQVN